LFLGKFESAVKELIRKDWAAMHQAQVEPSSIVARVRQEMEEDFARRTPESQKAARRGSSLAAGPRQAAVYGPYQIWGTHAEGCKIYDLDGNVYDDFSNVATALIHGYAHPLVGQAITEAYSKGAQLYGIRSAYRERLAEMIVDRVPGVDEIVFSCSGTESDMYAVRIARASSGREKVLRFRGGYHGTYDPLFGFDPDPWPGFPKSAADDVLLADYNDADGFDRALMDHASELAAVIVEPVLGTAGYIHQRDGFLQHVREATRKAGVLLIFDEVITGFRWARGGALERYGIDPPADLVVFGKIIGGGTPLGAVGGRTDVMQVVAGDNQSRPVVAGGTFAGNQVGCAAGIATLELLTDDAYTRLERLGERLRTQLQQALRSAGVAGQVTGDASVCAIHMTSERVQDARSAATAPPALGRLVRMGLINRGVIWSSGGLSTNTAMTEAEVDHATDAFAGTLDQIRPAIAALAPGLLG
jgi:glutamate-1-semialdehyde 2,1-aminomutase